MDGNKLTLETLISKMKKHTKEEKEKFTGAYDKDGFYMCEDGSYFDQEGYFFDVAGYDDIGGYYDRATGQYVPPPPEFINHLDLEEVDEYYEELCGFDDDSDNEDEEEDEGDEDYQIVDKKEEYSGIRKEHCLPALKWLSEQPKDKLQVIKICNIPRLATKKMFEDFMKRRLKSGSWEKMGIEEDHKSKQNSGVGYISSKDHHTLSLLIKLHYHVWAGYRLRTYVMGFTYDTDEELDDDHHNHKRVQQLGLQELDYRWIVKEKLKKIMSQDSSPVQANKPEEAKQSEKKDDDDDYGVETLG